MIGRGQSFGSVVRVCVRACVGVFSFTFYSMKETKERTTKVLTETHAHIHTTNEEHVGASRRTKLDKPHRAFSTCLAFVGPSVSRVISKIFFNNPSPPASLGKSRVFLLISNLCTFLVSVSSCEFSSPSPLCFEIPAAGALGGHVCVTSTLQLFLVLFLIKRKIYKIFQCPLCNLLLPV